MCDVSRLKKRGHSMLCILPPYILDHIASNGTPDQRETALQTLVVDDAIRSLRAEMTLAPEVAGPLPSKKTASPKKHRTIYDAHGSQQLPGKTIRKEGSKPIGDAAADEAYDGLGATFDFYLDAYHRNSIDDAGAALNASVHFGVNYDNAFWNGQQMVFGDGDGKLFNRFTVGARRHRP